MATDWFRRTNWTPSAEADFFARLRRARDKSQYLRIQAVTLEAAGDYPAALKLIDYYFDLHSEPIWNGTMHQCRASAHAAMGELDRAIAAFRASVEAERSPGGLKTDGWLDFGELVVLNGLQQLFSEIEELFAEFEQHHTPAFPVQRFRLCAIRAELAAARGQTDAARQLAMQALREAHNPQSGFNRHPNTGLVGKGHTELLTLAARRAAA